MKVDYSDLEFIVTGPEMIEIDDEGDDMGLEDEEEDDSSNDDDDDDDDDESLQEEMIMRRWS